jgi:hypothetical protein
MPGLALDFLNRIVNVHWGKEGLHFLYCGTDGMFGSEDGEKWQQAEGAVPATALAWVDDVWMAIGSGGPWRSDDGGKTWLAMGAPEFDQIAACKSRTGDGIFAGYKQDEEGDNEEVYISRDLGKSWSKELTVPTTINTDGYESARVLSGCGYGIFLSTIKGDELFSGGDGCVYALMDGGSFGGREQVWSGFTRHVDDPPAVRAHTKGYSPAAVGFDSKSRQYCLMGFKEEGFGPGGAEGSLTHYSIIYATGLGTSFAGETEIAQRIKQPLASNYSDLILGLGAAGGDGKFAGTYIDRTWAGPSPPLEADLVVAFFDGGSGSETLISVPDLFAGGAIGPVCWKPGGDSDLTTEAPEGTGTFACVAFDSEAGGVWIEKGGGWRKTHSGLPYGGIAVGKLSWLGSTDSGD